MEFRAEGCSVRLQLWAVCRCRRKWG